jgi:hypothetical protein
MSSLDSFKYSVEQKLSVKIYEPKSSAQQPKLNTSSMLSETAPDLNETAPLPSLVKTSFNVTNDGNVKTLDSAKNFVSNLKALEDKKFFSGLLSNIQKVKAKS